MRLGSTRSEATEDPLIEIDEIPEPKIGSFIPGPHPIDNPPQTVVPPLKQPGSCRKEV